MVDITASIDLEVSQMSNSKVPVGIRQLVAALNSIAALPTNDLTYLLEGAVCHGSEVGSRSLFGSLHVPNTYEAFKVLDTLDERAQERAIPSLMDFSALSIGHIATTSTNGMYAGAFQSCGVDDLKEWFLQERDAAGALMVLHILNIPLPEYPDEPASAQHKSVLHLICDPAMEGQLISAIHNGYFLHALYPVGCTSTLPIKLLFLLIHWAYPDSSAVHVVASHAAAEKPYAEAVDGYLTYDWLAGTCDRFCFTASSSTESYRSGYADLRPHVVAACNESRVERHSANNASVEMIGEYGPCIHPSDTIETTVVGERMRAWMAGTQSRRIAYVPYNERTEHIAGCVRAGTLISCVDGRLAPIEDIVPGTEVFAADGSVSITSSELVSNPCVPLLYAINDDEPFMSLDHAILTQDGFKCPDPVGARIIDPEAPVGELRVGDIVNRSVLNDDGSISYRLEEVKRIRIARNEGAMCYDLHFREGQRSYHANGYICYLNYPQVTSASLRSRLEDAIGVDGAAAALGQIASHDAVRTALGPGLAAQFAAQAEAPAPKLSVASDEGVQCPRPNLRFGFIAWERDGEDSLDMPFLDGFALREGRLFVAASGANGAVELPVQRDGRTFFFSHDPDASNDASALSEGPFAGAFRVVHHGLMAKGVIRTETSTLAFTAGRCDEHELKRDGVRFGSVRVETVPAPDGSSYLPQARLFLDDPENPDVDPREFEGCAVSVGMRTYTPDGGKPCQRLSLDVLTPVVTSNALGGIDIPLPEQIHLVFDEDAMGAVEDVSICPGHGITAEMDFVWSLRASRLSPQRLDAVARTNDAAHPPIAASLYRPASVLSPANRNALAGEIGLSVEELYSLPSLESLGALRAQAWSVVLTMALYVATDEQLGLFGLPRPAVGVGISAAHAELAQKHAALLRDTYLVAYLCQMFSDDSDEYIRAVYDRVDGARKKLEYFFGGDDSECVLGGSIEFAELMNEVNRLAYATCVPQLELFARDRSRDWAKELVEYAMLDGNVANSAGLTAASDHDMCRVRHVANMIDALEYSGARSSANALWGSVDGQSKSQRYLQAVAAWQFGTIALSCADVSGSCLPDGVPEKIVRMVAEKLVRAALLGEPFFGAELDPQVALEVRDDLLGENAHGFIGRNVDLREIINSVTSGAWALLQAVRLDDVSLFDKMAHGGAACSYACSAIALVMGFAQLGTSSFEKAEDYLSFAGSTLETLAFGAELFMLHRIAKTVRNTGFGLLDMVRGAYRSAPFGDVYLSFTEGGGYLLYYGHEANWVSRYKVARPIIKFAGIVAAAAFVAVSIIDIVHSVQQGYTVGIAVNAVELVSNVVSMGIAIAEVAGAVCPAFTPVLVVCVFVSFCCGLILCCNPPRVVSPAERYLSEHGVPFMKSLPKPSERFLSLTGGADLRAGKLQAQAVSFKW